jgi:hypothetical protein
MRCPACKRSMTALFTSYACDWCDGLKKPIPVARGWVIWRKNTTSTDEERECYVFPTPQMAEYYRSVTNVEGDVRQVLSETPIRWSDGKGNIKNLRLAERLYTIYPNHKFEPGPFRAFLAPEDEVRRAA